MRLVRLWLPVILWSAVILSASNDSFSVNHSGGWLRRIFGREVPFFLHVAIRKSAHLLEYAILGALAWRADRRLAVALAVAALVAITDETRQSFTASRTGSPWDVGLDVLGGAVGAWCMRRLFGARSGAEAHRRMGA
jgi:VanZ family protein